MILKNLEKKIWDFEGFQVRFVKVKGGRDVRGDRSNVGNYNFQRQAKGAMTVKEYKGRRLKRFGKFGWTGRIVLGDGSTAHGNTLLEKVRDSYA